MRIKKLLASSAFACLANYAQAEGLVNMDDPVIKEFVAAQALPSPERITKYAEACEKYKDLALQLPRMVQVSCLKRLSVLQGMSIATQSQVGPITASQIEVAVQAYFVVLTAE
jgi:hypothetical protein